MSGELAVVLCIDIGYVRYAFVTMQSVLETLSPGMRVKFYIFHENIHKNAIFIGEELFNTDFSSIEFVNLVPYVSGIQFNELHHWNKTVYYSGLIPQILRGRHHYALYLDADILVRHDVTELVRLMDPAKAIGAVAGYALANYPIENDPVYSGMKRHDYERDIIGLHGDQKRFNSGVMLFNLDILEEDFTSKYLALAEKHFAYTDEDIVNFLLKGRVFYFDHVWNLLLDYGANTYEIDDNDPGLQSWLKDPYILHYVAKPKPWQGLEGAHADLYRQQLAYMDLLISEI